VLAKGWVATSTVTSGPPGRDVLRRPGVTFDARCASVHGATARRLRDRGLAKSRCQLIDGTVVNGVKLALYIGWWSEYFTITAKGQRALTAVMP
jgi:hypothetical protein